MAYTTLINDIKAVIKNNGNQEITGQVLQTALVEMVNELGSGYTYKGVATLSTTPDVTTPNIFYLLGAVGTYTNIGGIQHASGIGIALWNGSAWSYQNVPTAAVVAVDATITANSTNPVQSGAVYKELLGYKNTIGIVSGSNLVNPSEWKDGYWYNSEVSSSSYRYVKIDISSLESGTTLSALKKSGSAATMRFVQFYNGTTDKGASQNVTSVTIPSNVNIVYVSFALNQFASSGNDKTSVGVFNSATPTWENYTEYAVAKWSGTPQYDSVLVKRGDLTSLDSRITAVEGAAIYNIEDVSTANLLNPSDMVHDKYWNNSEVDSTSYRYVKIGISGLTGTISTIKNNGSAATMRFVQFYNGTTQLSSEQSVTSATIPNNATDVYISFQLNQIPSLDDTKIGAFNSATPTWAEYAHYTKAKWSSAPNDLTALARLSDIEHSVLYGKKWAVLGDSFTYGATSTKIQDGKYKGKNYVYPYLIGNRTGINVLDNFFDSGRTLACPANPSTFTNSICNPTQSFYYQNIPSDVDYITIYLGINDSHHAPSSSGGDGEDNTGEIPIGTITDNTTSTYYGAWNVVLSWLIENRPFAHIGIIVSNGCDTDEYRTAQIAIARKYGIPFIDLNGDDRTPFMIRSRNTNIPSAIRTLRTQAQSVDYPSNTHPNDNAHLFESQFIQSFLESI